MFFNGHNVWILIMEWMSMPQSPHLLTVAHMSVQSIAARNHDHHGLQD